MSDQGPPGSTTRHVLHALASHMDLDGQGAFPSIATLGKECALSERAVGIHLDNAERQGWIQRKLSRPNGKTWSQYTYVATFPPQRSTPEQRSGVKGFTPEPGALQPELHDSSPPNDVPINSSINSSIELSVESSKEISLQERTTGRTRWQEAMRQKGLLRTDSLKTGVPK
jgi:hypothetical protein